MHFVRNEFKRRLQTDQIQIGVWASLVDTVATEILAGAGFDWLTIDAEHAPNDTRSILHQLQTLGGYDTHPIVRPLTGSPERIKQLLDLGAQTVLIPMVETAAQAAELVRAMHYPPAGIRGVASARAARWGLVEGYWAHSDAEVCLILQIETSTGVDNLEQIAAVEGVDALFIGPSDLGASLGHLGDSGHPDVREAVLSAISKTRAAGKAAGALAVVSEQADAYIAAGANFMGVGVDTHLLAQAARSLVERFQGAPNDGAR